MGFGLGVLRLAPRDFWAMTPRELTAAHQGLCGPPPPAPLGRARLAALMAQFPDDAPVTD